MPDAPTQNGNPNPGDGGTPPNGGGDGSGNGGSGNGTPPANNGSPSSQAVDLKALPADQLNQVLENPALWQHPRIKELVEAQRTLKKSQEEAEKQTEAQLKEQKKFEELSVKQADTIAQLTAKLETGTINQAITNKLSPLGVVDLEGALALIDRSGIKVDENGQVSGVDEAIEALKTGKAYLFNTGGGNNPQVGTPSNPGNGTGTGGPAKFKRSQLRDNAFYQANRDEILKAQAAGLIEDDLS
jgi:hypothetical protein